MSIQQIDEKLIKILNKQQEVELKKVKHSKEDIIIRQLVHDVIDMGKRLGTVENLEIEISGGGAAFSGFRQNPMIRADHIDESSVVKVPSTIEETGSLLTRLNFSLTGQYDLIKNASTFYISEGGSSKGSSAIFEEILVALMLELKGEQGYVAVMDCAPANTSSLLTGAMLLLFVELGLVEFAVIIFFWQYHGMLICNFVFWNVHEHVKDFLFINIVNCFYSLSFSCCICRKVHGRSHVWRVSSNASQKQCVFQ
jgi:hypothetical protein